MLNIKNIILAIILLLFASSASARECKLPSEWKSLCPVLESSINQTIPKMKLEEMEAVQLEQFLSSKNLDFKNLTKLQHELPKTVVELLMSIRFRHVSHLDAELMGQYLAEVVSSCGFQNLKSFDNNTSHIIGREWDEIDYSGEGMTWQKQKEKYAIYGVVNFKKVDSLKKFFPVEAKLPYFIKKYKYGNCKL